MVHNTTNSPILWIIGFPNSGKTKLAWSLKNLFDKKDLPTIVLDGDDIRQVLQMQNSGYSRQERIENALRIGRLAQLLSSQGSQVIVAANTFFAEVQDYHRANLPQYTEIYLESSEKCRRQRDQDKKLYSKFDKGLIKQVVGLDLNADIPKKPHIHIRNELSNTVEEITKDVMVKLHAISSEEKIV